MLRAIARALAVAVSGLWKGALGVMNFAEQLIRLPFSVVFGNGGGGRPTPQFEPATSGIQLLDEFAEARARQAAVHDLDRDGVRSVVQYAKAAPSARPTIDLGVLKRDIRATLLTMDDHELRALANAGIGEIRKFVEGRPHGIFGVPVVREPSEAAAEPSKEMSPQERVLWKVRSKLLKEQSGQDFKLAR